MKKIESLEDLLKWAREINSGVTLNRKVELQDVYAHSRREDLDTFFIESAGDRKLVICSVNNAMAFEEVEYLLKVLAHYKAEKLMSEETDAINRRERAIEEKERVMSERLSGMQEALDKLISRNETLGRENGVLTERVIEFREKADKYDKLRSLLS
jgi:hypothetical protein